MKEKSLVCLCGGVGGVKLLFGLASFLPPSRLAAIANVGDDFTHFGFHISPDLDTVMYTLAGQVNTNTGWGRADESWQCMDGLRELGAETWFNLGDRDLATHICRTNWLREEATLSEVTTRLCRRMGVAHDIVPATDDLLRTVIETDQETLAFQHYFVREQCRPSVKAIRIEGADKARPSPGAERWLSREDLGAVIICPSNPYLSIDPILAVPGIRSLVKALEVPVIAVSPLIAGKALKGPTAKIMQELGVPLTASAIARHYADVLSAFVLDERDEAEAKMIEAMGIATLRTNILMVDDESKIRLGHEIVSFADRLSSNAIAR